MYWPKVYIDQRFKDLIHRQASCPCQVGLPDSILPVVLDSQAIGFTGPVIKLILVESQAERKRGRVVQGERHGGKLQRYRVGQELFCAGPWLEGQQWAAEEEQGMVEQGGRPLGNILTEVWLWKEPLLYLVQKETEKTGGSFGSLAFSLFI